MSDAKQIRPSQVTMAGWMIIVASVVVVLTVFDQLASIHTVEARESVEKFLAEWPAKGLGLSVDSATTWWKVLCMVAAGCATAAGVLGWHVMRRHRASRIALTVIAVPLLFTGLFADGFFASLVAASALMLWSQPARDWFNGVTRPKPEVVHPSGAREPGTDALVDRVVEPSPESRVEPTPYAGFGAPAPVATGAAPKRPDSVRWACLLTWGFSAVTLMLLAVSAIALVADGSGAIEEARSQYPDLKSGGMSDEALLIGVVVFLVGLLVWALLAMVVAWFVWKGREWARIALICSAAVTAGIGVLAVLTSYLTFPLVIGAGVALRLLLSRPAAAWCRPPNPSNPPKPPNPPQAL